MHIEQQGLILNIKVKPATALHKKPQSQTLLNTLTPLINSMESPEYDFVLNEFYPREPNKLWHFSTELM